MVQTTKKLNAADIGPTDFLTKLAIQETVAMITIFLIQSLKNAAEMEMLFNSANAVR